MSMHHDLAATAQGTTGWSCHHRYRAVLERQVGRLKRGYTLLDLRPHAHLGCHQYLRQVGPDREVRGLVADNECAPVLFCLLDTRLHHCGKLFVDRVHLGMKLET